jgi:transketolase
MTLPNRPNPADVRRTILGMIYNGQASHLGTSMSMVEILVAAYGASDVAKIAAQAPDRDRIFVSKGHGAACTYAVMHHYGLIDKATVETYHRTDSKLAGHVSHAVPNVEHSTGALGHGLPVATGAAIGLRSKKYNDALVFCVMGDGEIQEGSVWEALMLASHLKLKNLIPIIDHNRISSIKATHDVINMEPLQDRFTGFGFQVYRVDGHDVNALSNAIESIRKGDRPSVIIADTAKGKGVPFAENQAIWHYRTLNEESYKQALAALEESKS